MNTYLFDIDGVLTNLRTPEVIQPKIFTILISFLKKGIPLGFISGRGMWWLRTEFIKKMESYVAVHQLDKNILDLLYVSGEFGVVKALHINGERIETMDEKFIIPQKVREKLTSYAERFKDIVFVEEKQTVFTLRSNFDIKEEILKKHKQDIITGLEKILQDYPEIEVLSDKIAINIRYKKANKTLATDNFISWLNEKGFYPEKYFVFGDSQTDLEMGLELQKQKLSFEFIYVGDLEELDASKDTFPVIATSNHGDEGTIEYLSAHLQ